LRASAAIYGHQQRLPHGGFVEDCIEFFHSGDGLSVDRGDQIAGLEAACLGWCALSD
jgi:hypothetical protein